MSYPTPRQLVGTGAAVAVVSVVSVVGVLAGWREAAVVGGAVALALLCTAAGAAATELRHAAHDARAVSDRVRGQVEEMAAQIGQVQDSLAETHELVVSRLERSDAHLQRRTGQLHDRITGLERAVADLPTVLTGALTKAGDRAESRLRAQLYRDAYTPLAAHADLLALIAPRAPMPPLGGWAVDADVLHTVVQSLRERAPKLIVECGSGSSSIWLGYFAERFGVGAVVALEHDERYLRRSRERVLAHELQRTVDVRHAPLEEWTGDAVAGPHQWYAPPAWQDLDGIGVLLVDGPPGRTGPQARYPAGPTLIPRCTAEAVIVLDDTHRPEERAISDRWLADWPQLTRSEPGQGTAHVFQLTNGG